jgi:hypothetical protein
VNKPGKTAHNGMKRFQGNKKNFWNYFLELVNFLELLAANFLTLGVVEC